ncbi:hypothetical protein EXIGLDRAFT_762601 [Exidia glandulosa HHB12029]|uniref:F-box domain-containing protein n=1 Tax=Exidia glandulosa HHB12029 TaxID=1314781 RepID=A0A165MN44_EXIGL|nr:hypothetical protein EXIGLDRAFT_762601 [Exidia glandulosa HHB12029]
MPHDTQSLELRVVQSPQKRVKRVASAASPLPVVVFAILHMVCGFMHPRDLLALARTSKALRKVIWNKSFKRAWESSLTTVDQIDAYPFPAEALHMSPAAYALLAFGSWCYHCQKRARLIHWALGIRLCAFCSKTQLVHGECIADMYPYYNLSHHQYSALYNLLCKIPWIRTLNRRNQYENHAYMPHALRDADRWLSLSAAGRAAFEQERKELAVLRLKHASLCESWMDYCASQREKNLADLRANRLSQICERLCDLGWAEEVRRERKTLCEHRRVIEPKVLTEKASSDQLFSARV